MPPVVHDDTPLSGALKRRIRFVINPVAGTRRKHRIPDKIERMLDKERYDFDIVYTQGRGHATQLAAEAAAEGWDVLAIAGGDGSVNEAATGLLGTKTALAILPMGSGNGLARHLGYSPWVKSTFQVINTGVTADIDVGYVNDQAFFSLVGIGFDAFVAKLFDREKTRGLATYGLAAMAGLLRYDGIRFSLESPVRNLEEEAFMINVCNANQYGYDFRVAPDASVTDGYFDVVWTERFPKRHALKLVYDLATENHLASPFVHRFQTDSLVVQVPERAHLQVDGEPRKKAREFAFRMEAAALRVLVNPHTHL